MSASKDGRDLRVVDTYHYLQSSSQTQLNHRFSLRELAAKSGAMYILNGGASESIQDPIPTGLLRASGNQYSRLKPQPTRLSGVLCVTRKGTMIAMVDSFVASDECRDALQSGPVVIEHKDGQSVSGITTEEPLRPTSLRISRSILCAGHNGAVYFIRTSAAHLFDVAEILLTISPRGGNKPGLCHTALNLSGDANSGLAVRTGKDQYEFFGNADATIASAILIPTGTP